MGGPMRELTCGSLFSGVGGMDIGLSRAGFRHVFFAEIDEYARAVLAAVRRLTPLECERLMGWPDGWTDIPWNKKDHAPDSRRYAACGNGVVAPVAQWIGERLADELRKDGDA